MKKIIMSIIGLAIALVLVMSIWVPIAKNSQSSASTAVTRSKDIDTSIGAMATAIP